ncbi:hypothetical protein ACJMK2_014507, partial [Sinanodonta woodiana]
MDSEEDFYAEKPDKEFYRPIDRSTLCEYYNRVLGDPKFAPKKEIAEILLSKEGCTIRKEYLTISDTHELTFSLTRTNKDGSDKDINDYDDDDDDNPSLEHFIYTTDEKT